MLAVFAILESQWLCHRDSKFLVICVLDVTSVGSWLGSPEGIVCQACALLGYNVLMASGRGSRANSFRSCSSTITRTARRPVQNVILGCPGFNY
jgi:hypothetical protein